MASHFHYCHTCEEEIESGERLRFCAECGKRLEYLGNEIQRRKETRDGFFPDQVDFDGPGSIVERFGNISDRFVAVIENRLDKTEDEAIDHLDHALGSFLDGLECFVELIEKGKR